MTCLEASSVTEAVWRRFTKLDGETMEHCELLNAIDNHSSYTQMEYNIRSLQRLVCDLLKKNQQLRDALSEPFVTAYSTAFHAPHEFGDVCCELGPQTGWQIMAHSLNQDEFCPGNGFGRRSPATDVAHAISETVDHESGDLQMSQEFGPIAGGD